MTPLDDIIDEQATRVAKLEAALRTIEAVSARYPKDAPNIFGADQDAPPEIIAALGYSADEIIAHIQGGGLGSDSRSGTVSAADAKGVCPAAEIVERLRQKARVFDTVDLIIYQSTIPTKAGPTPAANDAELLREAADAITQLTAERDGHIQWSLDADDSVTASNARASQAETQLAEAVGVLRFYADRRNYLCVPTCHGGTVITRRGYGKWTLGCSEGFGFGPALAEEGNQARAFLNSRGGA